MFRCFFPVLVAITAAAACTQSSTVDIEAEKTALMEAASAYHAAASAKDAERVVSMYGPDAMMIPPNAPRVEGLEEVRNYRFGFIETAGVELEFQTVRAEVSNSGDVGWTLAVGDIINRPNDEPGHDIVRDFHVWQKQDDGTWKVVVDIWNSELP